MLGGGGVGIKRIIYLVVGEGGGQGQCITVHACIARRIKIYCNIYSNWTGNVTVTSFAFHNVNF